MSAQEWPADDYAIGSYIQSTVAEKYLSFLTLKPTDQVLDIGCGNGEFTKKILEKVPEGSVLGVDASMNMLKLATNVVNTYPNFSVQPCDVLTLPFQSQFDYIVSFWCLQWCTDIHQAFSKILKALKPGGKVLTLFPAGNDPYIMGYYSIKQSGQFPSLENFVPPVEYGRLRQLSAQLNDLAFKKLNVELFDQYITLPSLDVFRKFVNGIAFYQGQLPESEIKLINEAMVDYFDAECRTKYDGAYHFNFTIYLVTGTK